MNIAEQTEAMLEDLLATHESLVQRARDLIVEYDAESRPGGVVYRSFSLRNTENRLRIDWQRHVFYASKGGGRRRQGRRIDLGKSYHQAKKFMGDMDGFHTELFNRYDPQLAKLREMADLNADARVALKKVLAAALSQDT